MAMGFSVAPFKPTTTPDIFDFGSSHFWQPQRATLEIVNVTEPPQLTVTSVTFSTAQQNLSSWQVLFERVESFRRQAVGSHSPTSTVLFVVPCITHPAGRVWHFC